MTTQEPDDVFADNDAALTVSDLPSGLTLEWGVVPHPVGQTDPSTALTAIHPDVSGTCTEQPGAPITYTAVLEGAAITARLLPQYRDRLVALVVRVGQDLRVVRTLRVRAARPV
jgi:hypothetical protein